MSVSAISLDGRGVDYIRAQLGFAHHLGKLVVRAVDWSAGSVVAIAPEPHKSDVYKFQSGIFPNEKTSGDRSSKQTIVQVPSTESEVGRWIHRALEDAPHRCFISESFMLRASDLSRAKQLPARTLACGGFVYHCVLSGDPQGTVESVVRMTYPRPLGFGVLASLSKDGIEEIERQKLTDNDLSGISKAAQIVVVGAYDGESVVVWKANTGAVKDWPGGAD